MIDIEIFLDPELDLGPIPIPRPEPRTEMEQLIVKKNETKGTKLNLPKNFNGDQNNFQKFLHTAEIYMGINNKNYDTNLKKIGFVLSSMSEGPAKAWADQLRSLLSPT